jgi:hypothetical protein
MSRTTAGGGPGPDAGRPVVAFDPAAYPGPRPEGPVLVHDGRSHDVEVVPREAADGTPLVRPRSRVDAPVLDPDAVRWIVAYGSNASPPRLVSKGLDRRGAVLLPARLGGWVPAFEHRRTGYGAVPLTLVPDAGATTATWLLGIHVSDTGVLDRSEGRSPRDVAAAAPLRVPARTVDPEPDDLHVAPADAYRVGRVGTVHVAGRWRIEDALAYLPGPRAEVQVDAVGRWRTWPAVDQSAAAAHLDADGASRPAPTVGAPVLGVWPRTTLVAVGP